jgi:hypothetical protein
VSSITGAASRDDPLDAAGWAAAEWGFAGISSGKVRGSGRGQARPVLSRPQRGSKIQEAQMMFRRIAIVLLALAVTGSFVVADQQAPTQQTLAQTQAKPPSRPASPRGTAATQVSGEWVQPKPAAGQQQAPNPRYTGGKWIEVDYGRPIKRERDLFGSGANYGVRVNDGSPVWRAGANQTTRLKTEVPLDFAGKTLPAGEYDVFVDLKEKEWTLIFSTWPFQEKYNPGDKTALWGSIGYTPDKDVLRVPMTLQKLPFSIDQFTIAFVDMTKNAGKLAMMWDTTMATAAFKVGQ